MKNISVIVEACCKLYVKSEFTENHTRTRTYIRTHTPTHPHTRTLPAGTVQNFRVCSRLVPCADEMSCSKTLRAVIRKHWNASRCPCRTGGRGEAGVLPGGGHGGGGGARR